MGWLCFLCGVLLVLCGGVGWGRATGTQRLSRYRKAAVVIIRLSAVLLGLVIAIAGLFKHLTACEAWPGLLEWMFETAQKVAGVLAPFGAFASVLALILSIYMIRRSQAQLDKYKESVDSLNDSLLDEVSRGIVGNLKANSSLSGRLTSVDVAEKTHLASVLTGHGADGEVQRTVRSLMQYLVEKTASSRKDASQSLFIESGSTLAYLGKALADSRIIDNASGIVRFTTNNVLVDQTLVFKRNATVNLFPGTPLGRYGATFGDGTPDSEPSDAITLSEEERVNQFDSATKYIGTKEQSRIMAQDIRSFFEKYGVPKYLVMTTSRLSLVDGPHVGSFQNRDFKKNMFEYAKENGIPFLLVVYDKKLHEDAMSEKECLRIFEVGDDPKNEPDDVDDPSGAIDEVSAFVGSIARGEVFLVITKADPSRVAIHEDQQTMAGAFFQILQRVGNRVRPSSGLQVLESPDRRVRIFAGKPRGMDPSKTALRTFVRDLRTTAGMNYASTTVWDAKRVFPSPESRQLDDEFVP